MHRCVALLLCYLAFSSAQNETSWQKYIVGPQSTTVYPTAIVSVSGNVTNPDGLIGGTGDAVFTRDSGDDVPEVVLDFGINVVGFLHIAFNGASTNSPGIRLAFSETLQFLSDLSDYSRSNQGNGITPGSDQIAVSSGPYLWNNTWGCQQGTQVCADGLHGFRYVKIYLDAIESDSPITQATGTVNIASVYLEFTAFLGTPDTFTGWFECSDEQLNQFWYHAVYTNDLTTDNFRENDVDPRQSYTPTLNGKLVLFDGAKRDRDPYVGDIAVSGITAYLSHMNKSTIAAKNVLADLGDNQRADGYLPPASIFNYTLGLFDYPLYWVISVKDYVMYTGEISFLVQYFPKIERILEEFYPAHTNNDTGLLSRPAGYGDFAFVGRDGEASYYNALYVLALKAGAQCSEWLNNTETSRRWLNRAGVVSDSTNYQFYDEAAGAYRNSRNSTSHPQDANAIAVLAGVADQARGVAALNYLTTATAQPYGNAFMDDDSVVGGGSQRVYAFISSFEILARFQLGGADSALEEIRRLHSWMLTHDPFSTFWEGIGAGGSMYEGAFTSAAHGWSTGVVGALTKHVLGLQILTPGGLNWEFNATPGDVTWAQGQVATMNGPMRGRWGDFNSTFILELDVPAGTKGFAAIPAATEEITVLHNGIVVWKKGKAIKSTVERNDRGDIVVSAIGEGKHIIVANNAGANKREPLSKFI